MVKAVRSINYTAAICVESSLAGIPGTHSRAKAEPKTNKTLFRENNCEFNHDHTFSQPI